MRIIQANKFYFLKGGAERYALELSAWLSSRGHEVMPFAMRHPDNLDTPYAEYFPGFVETERPSFGPGGLRTLGRMLYSLDARRAMARLADAVRPDVCHVHNLYTQLSPSPLDALAARRVPVVMTVHDHHLVSPQYNVWADGCGPDVSRAGVWRASAARFHKGSYAASFAQAAAFSLHRNRGSYRNRVDVFLVPSEYMRRQLVAAGYPSEKLRHLPFGVDTDAIRPREDHDGYVLFYGRLSEEKGAETVIRLAEQLPDISFRLAGGGPQEAALHARAHGLRNVEFLGFRAGDSLWDLVRGAACVLVPSRVRENFPLVALEAMACGKPVVGSHAGGMSEIVEDRVTGLLVPPLDIVAWAEAVMRLVYDEDARLRMARSARLRAETSFRADAHRAGVLRAYEDALAMSR